MSDVPDPEGTIRRGPFVHRERDVRVSYPLDPALGHDCDRMQIDSYELEETVIPDFPDGPRKAIRVLIRGRNLHSRAVPVMAFVGEQALQFMRVDANGRWLEGALLEEPQDRDWIDVVMEGDHVRHPQPLDRSTIGRIEWNPGER